MDILTAFTTVFGRPPTDSERQRLAQLSAGWTIKGNEALLAVLFVLELGADFREYPARCAESVRRAVRYALQQNAASRAVAARRARQSTLLSSCWALLALVSVAVTSVSIGASKAAGMAHVDSTHPLQMAAGALDITLPAAATLTVLSSLAALTLRQIGQRWRRRGAPDASSGRERISPRVNR